MRNILVTGGAGFVGRRFCRRFLEQGDEVHCVDNVAEHTGGIHPDQGWPLFEPRDYPNFHFHHEDCRSWFARSRGERFDYALHLAAMVGGRMMIEHNPLAVSDDLSIDSAYWQWARESRPGKTVFFSSSAAYPIWHQRRDGYSLLREDMIRFDGDIGMPDMTYGWAKLTGEYLSRLAHEKHGLRSVVYRPFSGYGEDQDLSYPFPAICKRLLEQAGAEVVTVWGTGEQMRDFIHIEDCVDGVLATMDRIDDGGALNLSSGEYISFKRLAGLIAEKIGYAPRVVGTSNTPEGVFARAGDTTRQRDFGFRPSRGLEQGIQAVLGHLEANMPLRKSA